MIPVNRQELQELISSPQSVTDCRQEVDEILYEAYCHYTPKKVRTAILEAQIETQMDDYHIYTSSLVKNVFAYTKMLEYLPNTKHYCLWLPENTNPNIEVEIFKWITVLFPNHCQNLEFDFYQNTRNNQSVKDKPHFQVFIHF